MAAASIRSGSEVMKFSLKNLLHEKADGTYCTYRSISLTHFLFQIIDPATYGLTGEVLLLSTHPKVYRVISALAQAIMCGSPPEIPCIPFKNTAPRLRLTLIQKNHMEEVLKKRHVIIREVCRSVADLSKADE